MKKGKTECVDELDVKNLLKRFPPKILNKKREEREKRRECID